MKSFVKMTAATAKSRRLKLQCGFCQIGCGDGIEKKEECIYFHIMLPIIILWIFMLISKNFISFCRNTLKIKKISSRKRERCYVLDCIYLAHVFPLLSPTLWLPRLQTSPQKCQETCCLLVPQVPGERQGTHHSLLWRLTPTLLAGKLC